MSRRASRDSGPGTLQPAGSHVTVPGGRLWTGQAGSGLAVLFAHAGIANSRTGGHAGDRAADGSGRSTREAGMTDMTARQADPGIWAARVAHPVFARIFPRLSRAMEGGGMAARRGPLLARSRRPPPATTGHWRAAWELGDCTPACLPAWLVVAARGDDGYGGGRRGRAPPGPRAGPSPPLFSWHWK